MSSPQTNHRCNKYQFKMQLIADYCAAIKINLACRKFKALLSVVAVKRTNLITLMRFA